MPQSLRGILLCYKVEYSHCSFYTFRSEGGALLILVQKKGIVDKHILHSDSFGENSIVLYFSLSLLFAKGKIESRSVGKILFYRVN